MADGLDKTNKQLGEASDRLREIKSQLSDVDNEIKNIEKYTSIGPDLLRMFNKMPGWGNEIDPQLSKTIDKLEELIGLFFKLEDARKKALDAGINLNVRGNTARHTINNDVDASLLGLGQGIGRFAYDGSMKKKGGNNLANTDYHINNAKSNLELLYKLLDNDYEPENDRSGYIEFIPRFIFDLIDKAAKIKDTPKKAADNYNIRDSQVSKLQDLIGSILTDDVGRVQNTADYAHDTGGEFAKILGELVNDYTQIQEQKASVNTEVYSELNKKRDELNQLIRDIQMGRVTQTENTKPVEIKEESVEQVKQEVEQVKQEVEQKPVEIPVEVDTEQAKQDIAEIKQEVEQKPIEIPVENPKPVEPVIDIKKEQVENEIKQEVEKIEPVEMKVTPRIFGDGSTDLLENEKNTKRYKQLKKEVYFSDGTQRRIDPETLGNKALENVTNKEDIKVVQDIVKGLSELANLSLNFNSDKLGDIIKDFEPETYMEYTKGSSLSEELRDIGQDILLNIAGGQYEDANMLYYNSDKFDISRGVKYLQEVFKRATLDQQGVSNRAKKQRAEFNEQIEWEKQHPLAVDELSDLTPEDLGLENTIIEDIIKAEEIIKARKTSVEMPVEVKKEQVKQEVEQIKEDIKQKPVEIPVEVKDEQVKQEPVEVKKEQVKQEVEQKPIEIPVEVKQEPVELVNLKNNVTGLVSELNTLLKAFDGLSMADKLDIELPKTGSLFGLVETIKELKDNAEGLRVELDTDEAEKEVDTLINKYKTLDRVINTYRDDVQKAYYLTGEKAATQTKAIYTNGDTTSPETLKARINTNLRPMRYGNTGDSDADDTDKILKQLRTEIKSDEVYEVVKSVIEKTSELEQKIRDLTRYGKDKTQEQRNAGFVTGEDEKNSIVASYSDISSDTYNPKFDKNLRRHELDKFMEELEAMGQRVPGNISDDELTSLRDKTYKNFADEAQKELEVQQANLKGLKEKRSNKDNTEDVNKALDASIKSAEDSIKILNDDIAYYSKSLDDAVTEAQKNIESIPIGKQITGASEIYSELSKLESETERAAKIYNAYKMTMGNAEASGVDIPENPSIDVLKLIEQKINDKLLMQSDMDTSEMDDDSGSNFDYIKPDELEDLGITPDMVAEESEKYKQSVQDQIRATQESIAEEVKKKEATQKVTQSINDEIAASKSTNEAKVNYADKLETEIKESGLSGDNLENVKSKQKSDEHYLKTYQDLTDKTKSNLEKLAGFTGKFAPMPDERVDSGSTQDKQARLSNYKQDIDTFGKEISSYRDTFRDYFSKVSTGDFRGAQQVDLDSVNINKLKEIVESGLSVNINEGTEAYDKLMEIKDFLSWLNKSSSELKIDVFTNEDAIQSEKLLDTQKLIREEKAKIARINDTIANKESFIQQYIKDEQGVKDRAYSQDYYTKIRDTFEKDSKQYQLFDRAVKQQTFLGAGSGAEGRLKEAGIALPDIEYTPKVLSFRSGDQAELTEFEDELAKFNRKLEEEKNKLNKNVEKLQEVYDKLNNSTLDKNSNEYKSVASSIEGVISKVKELNKSGTFNKSDYTNLSESVKLETNKAKDYYSQYLDQVRETLKEVKQYVSDQEALTGKPMSYEAQADYYKNQLPKFIQGTREYIEVLKLKNQAEQRAADEATRAAEQQKKAQQEALDAAKSSVQNVLGTIKKVADGINSAVNKIISIIRTGISMISKIIRTGAKVITTLGNGVRSIVTLFGNLANRIRSTFGIAEKSSHGLNGGFNLLKGSVTELRSKIQLLRSAFNSVFNNTFINKGKELLGSISTLNIVIGRELTQSTIEWAQGLEKALGVSATDLITDLKEISAVLFGLGMSSKDTAIGAQNLGMMSRYLGMMGLAGGNVDQVMNKLTSGIKGMTASIDDLGLSVRDAQMNSFLKDLQAQGGEFANIATDFSSLNEEARVYIRYASLIEQFKSNYDLSDFAKHLNTVTGRLSILSQTFSSFQTVIGVGFAKVGALLAGYLIPIIKRAQVYIEGAMASIQALLNRLGGFFDIDLSIGLGDDLSVDSNSLNGLDSVGDKAEDTKDKLDELSESAKKAGGNLQSFDRINNVTTSDGGSSGSEFDYSKLMNSALGSLEAYTKTADDYFDKLDKNLTDTLNKIKDKIKEIANELTGRVLDFGFDWESIKKNLTNVKENIGELFKSWGSFVLEIGLKIADDVNIGAIVTKLSEVLSKVTEVANTISGVLQPILRELYDTYIKPILETLGVDTLNVLDWVIEKLEALGKWFVDNPDKVKGFFDSLVEKLKIVKQAIEDVVGILKGKYTLDSILAMHDGTDWGNILTIIESLKDILGQLLDKLGEFVTSEGLPWLQEQLTKLAEWIKTNKDKIVELFAVIGNIAWEGFQIFVNLVGKLIDYVVKNPDSVLNFFTALLGLKVASWFTSTAASIGLALTSMQGFTGLLGKLGIGASATGAGATVAGAGATGATVAGATGATGGAVAGAGATGAATAGGVALGPIAIVVAAVVALTVAIKDLWDTSESFRNSIGEVWENIKKSFTDAIDNISESFGNIKTAFENFYTSYEGSGLKELLEVVLVRAFENLGTTIKLVIDVIGSVITYLGNSVADIINIVSGIVDVISGVIKTVLGLFVGLFTGDWEMVKQGAGQAVTGLMEILGGIIQGFIDLIRGLGDVLFDIGNALTGGLLEGIKSNWDNFWSSVRGLLDSFITNIKEFFGIHSPSTVFADIGINIVTGLINGIKNSWSTLTSSVNTLFNGFIDTVKTKASDLWGGFTTGLGYIGDSIQYGWNTLTNRTSARTGRRITTNANGGSIAGGQLFIANENGVPELIGNIDGTGRTNVANNNMIMDAMRSGVFEAVYNAMAEVHNQQTDRSVGSANIKIDGFGLIDQSTLRELARLLAPYLNGNSINIADTEFSI